MTLSTVLMDASMALSELPDRATYLDAARRTIGSLLPADDVFWIDSDFAAKSASVWHGPTGSYDAALSDGMAQVGDHPIILSFIANPADLSARRISDVVTGDRWRRTAAHELLHTLAGQYQLGIVLSMPRPMGGLAWVLGRETSDFSDDELAFSLALQPLLTALDRMYRRCVAVSEADMDRQAQAREQAHLSTREVDILTLVAAGLTADAVSRIRRISILTVRKHLQNIYAKLGYSDRLLAVDKARRLGILPWPTTTSTPTSRSAVMTATA